MSFKKTLATAGCALGLIATTAVFAGGPGEFDNPQKPHHIYVYGELMFPHASEEGGFVGVNTTLTPDELMHHDSKLGYGGTGGASYIFDNRSDLRAEYTYLPGHFKDATFNSQNFTLKKTYQAVNLDLGQYWNPVPQLTLHFFTGVAYRNYKSESNHPYVDAGQYTGTSGSSKFSGWGPRFGIDSSYDYTQWLDLIANVAMSFPYGPVTADAIKNSSSQVIPKEKIDKFVPELAGNAGLQFNHDFNNFWAGLEVGYRVIHLMNSDLDEEWLSNSSSSATGFKFHDTTFYGPYIRLSAKF